MQAGSKQFHQFGGDGAMAEEGLLDSLLRERQGGLFQVFGDGAQQHTVAPSDAGGEHEGVEAVVFHTACPYFGKQRGQFASQGIAAIGLSVDSHIGLEREVVQADSAVFGVQGIGYGSMHIEPHVPDDGQSL